MRVFSAVMPSGNLHIGNYIGAIKNWLELQNKYQCIFSIANYHAITVKQDPKILNKKILEIAKIYLASGLDPKKVTIFIQSYINEHTELAWILGTLTKISELERMTQFKEKAKQHKENINLGLFSYPVLQAADILLYQTEIVPVGEDQKQHIEFTANLAKKFNRLFGETFIIPEALIKEEGARIMGLDNPLKKMSKSAESPYNYLGLLDPLELVEKKIAKAITDSGAEIKFLKDKPAIFNLLTIYKILSKLSKKEVEEKFKNSNYADFKKELTKIVKEFLEPLQENFYKIKDKEAYEILQDGADKASRIAKKTIKQVKEKIGLI
ncbi:MAG: tryptophan--tRNA ligase [Candidatus Kuenenbacteria bacterium]